MLSFRLLISFSFLFLAASSARADAQSRTPEQTNVLDNIANFLESHFPPTDVTWAQLARSSDSRSIQIMINILDTSSFGDPKSGDICLILSKRAEPEARNAIISFAKK